MPKIIPPLTAAQCKKLKYHSTSKSTNRIRDGRGLILEARPNGRKVWLLEYMLGNKRSYATMPHDYDTSAEHWQVLGNAERNNER